MKPPPPIPITVLTGFLGAGKTTLLNRLLQDEALADSMVIVNEFGEIGLDHLLVESIDEGIVLLSAGCLCCSVRGDLVATLEDLLRRRDNGRIAPFRRVLIETTGLADPGPILHAVLYHPYLSRRYAIAGVVAVVDAVNGSATLDAHEEAVRQVAIAERIVVAKADLADPAARAALEERLSRLAPGAQILSAVHGDVPARDIVGQGPPGADPRAWIAADAVARAETAARGQGHAHDAAIRSFCLSTDLPVRRGTLELFLDLLRSAHGPKLLRLKGIVQIAEDPERPVVIHCVQHVVHVPAILDAWPDDDRRSRLVFIVKDLDRSFVERLWNAFLGRPGIDEPDAAALADNPLAVPGRS